MTIRLDLRDSLAAIRIVRVRASNNTMLGIVTRVKPGVEHIVVDGLLELLNVTQ